MRFQLRSVPDSARSADRTGGRCPLPSGSGNTPSWARRTRQCPSAGGERIPGYLKRNTACHLPPYFIYCTSAHAGVHLHCWCGSTANLITYKSVKWHSSPAIYMNKWRKETEQNKNKPLYLFIYFIEICHKVIPWSRSLLRPIPLSSESFNQSSEMLDEVLSFHHSSAGDM